MPASTPDLEAIGGRGFAHMIVLKNLVPVEIVANVCGEPAYWPLAQQMAAAPRLLAICQDLLEALELRGLANASDWPHDPEIIDRLVAAIAAAGVQPITVQMQEKLGQL